MRQIGKPCLQGNVGDTKRFGGWIAQQSAGRVKPPLQKSPAKRFARSLEQTFQIANGNSETGGRSRRREVWIAEATIYERQRCLCAGGLN